MEFRSLLTILGVFLLFVSPTTIAQALVKSEIYRGNTELIMDKLRTQDLKIIRLQEQIDECKSEPMAPDILFTSKAKYNTDGKSYHTYLTGQTVAFSDVILNTGGGYNPADGVFTCPRGGTYMISVVLIVNDPALYFDVMKNSEVIGRIFSQRAAKVGEDTYAQWVSSSITMFSRLESGDRVYLKSPAKTEVSSESLFSMRLI